jgi:hypothetical protein
MHNIIGELVFESNEGIVGAGEHSIRINSSDMQAGIYLISIGVNDNKFNKRVAITK